MALTQDERLSISKKIVSIPLQNAAADVTSAQIEIEKAKAQKEDDANKTLMDNVTVYVNLYQPELTRYDGNSRTQLLEQDLTDAVNRKLNNFFFPNNPQIILPSLPDGIWKNFVAFSGSRALGKTYTEGYTIVQKEQDIIDIINGQIAIIEALSAVTRSTGQACTTITPTPPPVLPPVDTIAPSAPMQAAATALKNAVQDWENFINATYTMIPTALQDPEATRLAQNDASRADITNAVSQINSWQAITDFYTGHGASDCATFNSLNVLLFPPTKFRAAELDIIKNEVTARQAFIATRTTELNGHLGTVVQNLTNGELTSATGFYGSRMRIIDVRLNAMGGSLSKLTGLSRGQAAQLEAKKSNDNAALVYGSVMVASAFRAPSIGTSTIHVLDASGFSIGNTVYVAAENQEEITTTVVNVQGNSVFLANIIPQKYRQNEFARLYKVL